MFHSFFTNSSELIRRSKTLTDVNSLLSLLGALAISLALPSTSFAQAQKQNNSSLPKPATYIATYKAIINGAPVTGKAERSIRQDQQNKDLYIFNSKADAFVVQVNEESKFLWSKDGLIPESYLYKRSGLLKSEKESLIFDHETKKVMIEEEDEEPTKKILAQGTLDKLLYQAQMPLDLAQGKKDLHYQVQDGDKLKRYHFKWVGEEQLNTALGKIKTAKVSRVHKKKTTEIWFSLEHNYLLVQLEQKEKKDADSYRLEIKSYQPLN